MKRVIPLILLVLFLVAAGAAGYFYTQYAALKKDPQKLAQEDARELVAKIGQLIVLPEGEEPTIATVNEPEKLKDQVFFSGTLKGDKVLIYTNAKKAILYRPDTNKIVGVAPVNIGNPTPQAEK